MDLFHFFLSSWYCCSEKFLPFQKKKDTKVYIGLVVGKVFFFSFFFFFLGKKNIHFDTTFIDSKAQEKKRKVLFWFWRKKGKTKVTSKRLKSCYELIKTSIIISSVLSKLLHLIEPMASQKNHKLGLLIYKCIWFWAKPSLIEICVQRWLMQQQSWGFVQHQSRIFCATRKCNTEIYQFCNQKFQHFLQQKSFVAKNVKISDCKNGRLPCCTSVLHKMSDFGVAQNLNFVVALVIAAHKFLLFILQNNSNLFKMPKTL